jgi:hypothetical protein
VKLPEDVKLSIQWFVYYLFKGTLDARLIEANFDYVPALLTNRQELFNCFEVFVHGMQTQQAAQANHMAASYILALHEPHNPASVVVVDQAIAFNRKQSNHFWISFLDLAHRFCNNTLPQPLREDYILTLDGNGTDAVPAFAVWTNVIEVNDAFEPLNAYWALQRASERLKLWEHVQPAVKFENWELEQEIY